MTSLLRFLTCGSVDDGKSTLIGRMLFDAGLIPQDQLAAIRRASAQRGQADDAPDLSLLMDGLLDERAQGITIDVAWRYFQTPRRKFIMGDAPGHEQYTRNMVTAASQCDAALILIDARKGVLPQTRRHAAIVALLGIEHIAVVINKMDMVDWSPAVFGEIQADFLRITRPLKLAEPTFLPVSALRGDNVVAQSKQMPWYSGRPLLALLEELELGSAATPGVARLPVQWVCRTAEFRGYAGTLSSGKLRVGDEVVVLPTKAKSRIASIVAFDRNLEEAVPGQAITVTLRDEIDVSRGDTLAPAGDRSAVATDRIEADLVWMDEEPMLPGRRYEVRIGTASVPATVRRLVYRLDLGSMQQQAATRLEKNDLGRCELMLEREVPADPYAGFRDTGSLILVDRISNATAAAGMVRVNTARQVFWEHVNVDKAARANAKGQVPRVVWFTGLSGAGKSTIANAVEGALHQMGLHTYLIDGDNVRHGLCKDLGFTAEDRIENTRRVGELARLMLDAGLIVLVSLISPFRAERRMVRELMAPGEFIEVHMSTPLPVCEQRDRKGLYRMAREGKLTNFTGISSPYEAPEHPELVLDTSVDSIEACVARVVALVK